jgi:hypothetical protein
MYNGKVRCHIMTQIHDVISYSLLALDGLTKMQSFLFVLHQGAQELSGEYLKFVWAEFSTICFDDMHVLIYMDARPRL